jgi:hypothetical protein
MLAQDAPQSNRKSANVDPSDIRRFLKIQCPPDSTKTFEIRCIPSGNSIRFDAETIEAAVRFAASHTQEKGIYFTINPVDSTLNRSASDNNIVSRDDFFIDIDSERPNRDLSATNEERAAVSAKTNAIIAFVCGEVGFPEPIRVDSGNGEHLHFPIDMPNDEPSRELIKKSLQVLADRFNDEKVKIDTVVHNASRIARLPGTVARKGIDTPDRPHRTARILSVPDELEAVPTELFDKLISLAPLRREQRSKFAILIATNSSMNVYASAALEREISAVANAKPGSRNNALNKAAFALGGFVASGELDRSEVERELRVAALFAGLAEPEISKTIRSGIDKGLAAPRTTPAPNSGKPAANGNGKHDLGELAVTCADDIVVKPIKWLVPNRIPRAKLTLFAGEGGVGKSTAQAYLVGCFTTGRRCFDLAYDPPPPMDVLMVCSEDAFDDTIKPRLLAAQADLRRVFRVDGVYNADRKGHRVFDASHAAILGEYVARNPSVGAIFIDPLSEFVGRAKVDDHKDSELRSVLSGFTIVASERNLAVIGSLNLNKGDARSLVHRVGGSSAYVNVSRFTYIFAEHPIERGKCVMIGAKKNLAPDTRTILYEIQALPPDEQNRITSKLAELSDEDRSELGSQLHRFAPLGECDVSKDELEDHLREKGGRKNDDKRIVEWLADRLKDGPVHTGVIAIEGNVALERKPIDPKDSKALRTEREFFIGKAKREPLEAKVKPLKDGDGKVKMFFLCLPNQAWPPNEETIAHNFRRMHDLGLNGECDHVTNNADDRGSAF